MRDLKESAVRMFGERQKYVSPVLHPPCTDLYKEIARIEKEWGFPPSAKEGKAPHWIVVEYARRAIMTPEQLSRLNYEPPPIPRSYSQAPSRQELLAKHVLASIEKEGYSGLESLNHLARASTLIFSTAEED
jgi:hypothetical protein